MADRPEKGLLWVDWWGNRYDACPVCGAHHQTAKALALCFVKRPSQWAQARRVDGVREVVP